jgi:lysozyme
MNINQLRKELERDEGCKYEIYLDHLGYPTFGIGHLITDDDPESKVWPLGLGKTSVGTEVSEERVKEAFNSDIETVLSDCCRLYEYFDDLPEEVQLIIANMMFNLGYPRLSKFKGMKRGVDERDWNAAADEMVDSLWYRQVTNRANRLVERMRNV